MVLVSVVIVNFNGEALLEDCLVSLNDQVCKDFEVIFVDNGSSDCSAEKALRLMPRVRLVKLKENAGWARGNNIGIEATQGKYIVVLNNDTRVDKSFLGEIVQVAEADERIGMVAPKILNFSDSRFIDSVGGLIICRDGIAQGRGRGEMDQGQYDHLKEVLMPSGCAGLYRKRMLDEIGLFDDDFFAYCEDSDLGLRACWAGWKAVSAPKAIVYHKYSATSGEYSPAKLYFVERNHFYVVFKNYPLSLIMQLPFWSLYRYVLMTLALMAARGKGTAAVNGKSMDLLKAFIRGQCHAALHALKQSHSRPKVRRLTPRQFAKLLKEFRLSQFKMIFNH